MKRILSLIKKRLAPEVLRKKKISGQAPARQAAGWGQKPTVINLSAAEDPWNKVEPVWRKLWAEWFKGRRILVKVNLNTADPYPASTCPIFLQEFLQFLQSSRPDEILVGDCSSLSSLPTRKTAHRVRLDEVVAGLANLVYFDEMDWVEVVVPGQYLNKVTVPAVLYQVDRIINLTNLKTHRWADFSMALKAAVGYMHPMERGLLHQDNLQQKIAELNLAVMADLNIIDGRIAMIDGGPVTGLTVPADLILIGDHPAAVDFQAYQELLRIKHQHRCVGHFTENPLDMPQLGQATRIWPPDSWQDYQLLQY